MKITRIGKKNCKFFDKLLLQAAATEDRNVIKLGVVDDDTACGAAAFRIGEYEAELLSLYVAPEYRRRGAAQKLMDTFEELADDTGLQAIMAVWLREMGGLAEFLQKNGFLLLDGSPAFSFRVGDALKSEKLKKYLSGISGGSCVPVSQLSPTRQKALEAFVKNGGFEVYGPILTQCSGDVSFVALNQREMPVACMLCTDMGDTITVDILLSDAESHKAILRLFGKLHEKMVADGREDTEICCLAINPQIPPMLEILLGECVQSVGNTVCAVRALTED
ncbi:MAG: GNAT family N-acetyltransferase [Lachnospiraceae bacterium]|nr:GNAT family N-acetyltransferase [Lachnospiraceae bacterium]